MGRRRIRGVKNKVKIIFEIMGNYGDFHYFHFRTKRNYLLFFKLKMAIIKIHS